MDSATAPNPGDRLPPPPAGERFAARRLYRLMTLSLGITTLIELASVLPLVITQIPVLGVAYTVVTSALIVAPSVTQLFLFARSGLPLLRILWRVQAVAMLLVYAGIPIALGAGHLASVTPLNWAIELEVVAGCAAGLGWRLRGALAYAVTLQLVVFGVALFSTTGYGHMIALGDAVRQLFYVAMFMSLVAALLRAGRLLDDTVDQAVAEVHALSAAERRRSRRQRLELLIHDRIIVALLAYAAGAGPERSANEAIAALAAVDSSFETSPREIARSPRAFAWELQGLTTRLNPEIRFEYTATRTGEIPAEASTAIAEAYAEALRNSLCHAAAEQAVTRQVHATIGADRVEVSVLDDGRGFDPTRIGPARLGIRHGIIGRMHAIEGGDATVHSAAGYGTTVTLRWERP